MAEKNGTILKNRNDMLDYLKGISCLSVIFLHCKLYGIIGDMFIYAVRFPVPIFFMITGYYCEIKDNEWIKHKMKSLFIILLLAEVGHFLVRLISGSMGLSELVGSMMEHPIRKLFCGTFFDGTLWYFYAIFWAYAIILMLRRTEIWQKTKFRITAIVILVAVQVLGRVYVTENGDIYNYVYLFRNAITFGLPMLFIGMEVRKYESLVIEMIKPMHILLIIGMGFVLMVVEYFVYGKYMDFHFSTLFISVGIFVTAIAFREQKFVFKRLLSYIGHRLSLWVYVIHPFCIFLFEQLVGKLYPDSIVYQIIKPFMVLLATLIVALLIDKSQTAKSTK